MFWNKESILATVALNPEVRVAMSCVILLRQSNVRKPHYFNLLQPRWIMFICRIFSFVSLYTGAVLAKPLRIVNENTLSPSVSNVVDAAFGSNVSTSTLALANYNIECNGTLYGFNPNIADCENAAQSIMPDREQITWSERRPGSPGDFFSLPFAVFGGKW